MAGRGGGEGWVSFASARLWIWFCLLAGGGSRLQRSRREPGEGVAAGVARCLVTIRLRSRLQAMPGAASETLPNILPGPGSGSLLCPQMGPRRGGCAGVRGDFKMPTAKQPGARACPPTTAKSHRAPPAWPALVPTSHTSEQGLGAARSARVGAGAHGGHGPRGLRLGAWSPLPLPGHAHRSSPALWGSSPRARKTGHLKGSPQAQGGVGGR